MRALTVHNRIMSKSRIKKKHSEFVRTLLRILLILMTWMLPGHFQFK